MSDLETFAEKVRVWFSENLPPRVDGRPAGRRPSPSELTEARDVQCRLFEAGLAGLSWPAEFGGQGLTTDHERVFRDEAERFAVPDFGALRTTTYDVCGPVMLLHASEEFNRRHIPRILRGEELWCQFFSEPSAGSDLAAARTRADRSGADWELTGSKIWSTMADAAEFGMCLARTRWDVPKHEGLTWFGVATDSPGLTIQPLRQVVGGSDFCQELFDAVSVPDAERIGPVDGGWRVARSLLAFERSTGRAPVTQSGEAGLAGDLVALARRLDRHNDPWVQQQIGRVQAIDYLQGQLGHRVAQLAASGRAEAAAAASYAKLASGMGAAERATIALLVAGGDATMWEAGDPQGASTATSFVGSVAAGVAGGTNEMQRNAIAERILGLPREPSYDRDMPFSEVLLGAPEWRDRSR